VRLAGPHHLQNNPAHRRSGGCRFIKDSPASGAGLIRRRRPNRRGSASGSLYPSFPGCIGHRPKSGRLVLYSTRCDPLVIREIHRHDRHQLAAQR
jgi:hypothetical protein